MDDLHFLVAKRKYQFKIKAHVGPFICNTKTTTKEENILLKQMKFKLSFIWSYDPLGIISKFRVEKKTTPYTHTPRPKIEKYMNQNQLHENTLQEPEEYVISTMTSQTPVLQERGIKYQGSMFPF